MIKFTLILISLSLATALRSEELPEGWAADYEEALWYSKTVDDLFSRSILGLKSDGEMLVYQSVKWHRGSTYFKNGVQRLSRVYKGPERVVGFYGDGPYTLILHGHTDTSYSYSSNQVNYRLTEGRVSEINVPSKNSIDRFPNPWYFHMADFLSWRMGNRFDLGDENPIEKKIELTIDNQTGKVTRSRLAEEYEKCLHWLIYRDGKLISNGSAKEKTTLQLINGESETTEAFTVLVVAEAGKKRLLVSPLGQYCQTEKTGWIHLPFWEHGKKRITWDELGM